jgi:hypothetical protein
MICRMGSSWLHGNLLPQVLLRVVQQTNSATKSNVRNVLCKAVSWNIGGICAASVDACITCAVMMQERDENMFPRSVRACTQPYYSGTWCEKATRNRERGPRENMNQHESSLVSGLISAACSEEKLDGRTVLRSVGSLDAVRLFSLFQIVHASTAEAIWIAAS